MALEPRIGVVTVTFNSGAVLEPFLNCVFNQGHRDFLLFAVDNASKDDTLHLLKECGDERLRVIANLDNRGVAEGNNQGIRAALEAGCDTILLLNNDTEFDSELFVSLVQGLDNYKVDMCCPKMMYFDHPDRIWAAGGKFQPLLGYRATHIGLDELDGGQFDLPRQIDYVPTCCVLIKKEVFAKIGLMDARYFVYVDDTDFMYRAMKAGLKLLYLPSAKLLHKVGSLTGQGESPFAVRFCTRNRVYFMFRHLGALRSMPLLILYQVYFLLGLMTGRADRKTYSIRQKAVVEGISLWRHAPLSGGNPC